MLSQIYLDIRPSPNYGCTATNGGLLRAYTPCSGYAGMTGRPIPCRIHSRGGSHFVLLAKEVLKLLPWREGDILAARVVGEKLVMERIPLERMSIIRTGEALPNAEGSPDH